MKKVSFVLVILALVGQGSFHTARAQVYYAPKQHSIELTPYGGFILNTNITVAYGYVKTKDNPAYGAAMGFNVQRGVQIEFQYLYHSTTSSYVNESFDGPADFSFDVVFQYFMLNFVREIKPMAKVNPYVSVGGGIVWANPDYKDLESAVRAAMQLGGGVKISLSDAIALRLQGQVLFPLVFYSGGLYVGTGGAGLGVSAGVPLAQFNFSAGLTFYL